MELWLFVEKDPVEIEDPDEIQQAGKFHRLDQIRVGPGIIGLVNVLTIVGRRVSMTTGRRLNPGC